MEYTLDPPLGGVVVPINTRAQHRSRLYHMQPASWTQRSMDQFLEIKPRLLYLVTNGTLFDQGSLTCNYVTLCFSLALATRNVQRENGVLE